MRRASRRLITRPSPVPPYFRVVELSAWENDWNSLACCSGEIPMPVSVTLTRRNTSPGVAASPASATDSTFTSTSPFSVNLNALLIRLVTTWRNRRASPRRRSGTLGSAWVMSSTCFWITTERNVSVTSSRTSLRLNGALSSWSLSASIFEKSRMSFRMPRRFLADEWATLMNCCGLGGRSASSARPVMFRIAFIGVRIS